MLEFHHHANEEKERDGDDLVGWTYICWIHRADEKISNSSWDRAASSRYLD